jgi:GNAT superfamily N-acetyltransferase
MLVTVKSVTPGTVWPPDSRLVDPRDFSDWIDGSPAVAHFLAYDVTSGGRELVGHVMVDHMEQVLATRADDGQTVWRSTVPEVWRAEGDESTRSLVRVLAVAPDWSGRRLGRLLLRQALQHAIRVHKRAPVLQVMDSLASARALYTHEGGVELPAMPSRTGPSMIPVEFVSY